MTTCDHQLFEAIRGVLLAARGKAQTAVNFAMVVAYWKIGQLIVDRQGGRERAAYGNGLIEGLSEPLSREFGKSLDARELRRMRQFYLTYPIREALRPELGWTHYRLLLSVESEDARGWYLKTAADEGWTTRQLQRQIGALYYERMQASPDPPATRSDALTQFGKEGIDLVLCSKKNEAVAHDSVLNESKQIFASKYILHLPPEDDLKREIERERLLLDCERRSINV